MFLFVFHFTTLSVSQKIQRRVARLLMNNEWERSQESVMALIEIPSGHFSGTIEENDEKPQLGWRCPYRD
jgi:hypothetical protein